MDYKPLLPAPLMKAAHIAPFDKLIRNYVGGDDDLGIESKIYYATILNIDTCPSVILPYLAEMFGVEGIKGFKYCPTEALQRRCIKDAILMKRRHGTVWALKRALENAGFQNVVITDHLPLQYWDGSIQFDGTHQFNSYHWAHFKVKMEPPIGVLVSQVDMNEVRTLINYWKRKCTLCVGILIEQLHIDDLNIGDDAPFLWDGTKQFDGSELSDGVL